MSSLDLPSKSVVVTGVSTGIGWGTTKVLIQHGYQVFGSVRKTEDARRLSAEFGAAFTPLLFDVTDEEAVQRAAALVAECLQGNTLAGLVNNAGIAVPGPLIYLPVAEFRRELEVNLVGPLIVTQAFAALLGADRTRSGRLPRRPEGERGRPGRIVNISSVGGQFAGPFLGAYHASKFGLEGFSTSLRRELQMHGIDVIVVGPGAVATPIWDKAEQLDTSAFQETEYGPALEKFRRYMIDDGRKGLTPEQLGEVVLEALTAPHPRTRYAAVPGSLPARLLPRLLPARWIDALLARNLGLRRA